MYRQHPTIVLGFHACEKAIGEDLVSGRKGWKPSKNDFDWLGSGMYFWEKSPVRAERYAEELVKRGQIKEPMVVGAVINLGHCFDLLDARSLEHLRGQYDLLKTAAKRVGMKMPENKPVFKGDQDKLKRNLDCAVINTMHVQIKNSGGEAFDSVRAAFWEGKDLYPGAGFSEKNHIQLCIRNPNCIKGFFKPLELNEDFKRV